MRVLLVEDDLDLAENIIDYMEDTGYTMDYAMNGEAALKLLSSARYEVVILDVGLPGIDGFDVCKKIREDLKLDTSIIMLTARAQLHDKLAGFEAGTDDYLPKPFELPELRVRIDAIARRGHLDMERNLKVGELEYDMKNGILLRAGKEINLPPVCNQIVKKLMLDYPDVVSRSELEYAIWGNVPPETNALKSHWYTLRLLADKPFNTKSFVVLRGKGYKVQQGPES